jgi:hypothetical protein
VKRTLVILAAAAAVLAPQATAAQLPGFRSPSGNIECLYVPGPSTNLLCSIGHATYARALQARCMGPTGAGVDWHGFSLGATTKGSVLCTGGILYNANDRPSYVTLAYGKTWRHGAFTCSSRLAGVTCRNRAGHGLFISRQSWRAF